LFCLINKYFVNKERNSLKDVLEVNSALAAANYCLDGIDKEQDFLASGNYLKKEARSKKLAPKEIFATSPIVETYDWEKVREQHKFYPQCPGPSKC
jgi:hypothetical protein